MDILLDTHILLWWLEDSPQFPVKAKKIISNMQTDVFVSAASIWEVTIKKKLGKLFVPDDIEEMVLSSSFRKLDISFSHAQIAGSLPRHHDDPFDRMLIAQSEAEKLTLMTHDRRFQAYKIPLILI